MWVFGYGSLIWRPSIPFTERAPCTLNGYARRFWQGSLDHRGVPGSPGRVVTLVPDRDATCTGVAYAVPSREREAVLARLDHREQGGYDRLKVKLVAHDGRLFEGLVYLATPDNPCWLGPAPIDAMVKQIARSVGPSGPNREYLIELDRSLEALGAVDPHVRALADGVRAIGFR